MVEKILSIINFQTCEEKRENRAEKAYYLRDILSSSETQKVCGHTSYWSGQKNENVSLQGTEGRSSPLTLYVVLS